MSCFWIGLITSLSKNNLIKTCPPQHFLQIIKLFNKPVKRVLCNGELPSRQQQIENVERILNITQTNDGYDCSCCDPVLLLVSMMYKVDIVHDYNNTIINYRFKGNVKKQLSFKSNIGHFWNT